MTRLTALAAALLFTAACGGQLPDGSDAQGDESGLDGPGDIENVTGSWGSATTCKTLPAPIAQLKDPVVVVSLDGMTLHLWDRQGTFDKVYPIGPGKVEGDKSLTPVGHFSTGPADPVGAVDNGKVVGSSPWAWWYSCKIWWTDPDTKQVQPVYAGLPLIRLKGAPTLGYAIHGPIDAYSQPNGGMLRRALVSHGCVRMRAADILEVFVLLRSKGNVPVTIQRAVERDANGKAIDLPNKWIGSECDQDADCNFAGGTCRANPYGHKVCTAACTGSCADRDGEIATACVPDGAGKGMCVRQASTLNNFCRPYEGFELASATPRFGSSRVVDACVPGSGAFIGDSCLVNSDCGSGRTCERKGQAPGLCTQPCDPAHACPTKYGMASVCVANRCLRACDVQDACGAATPTTCLRLPTSVACVP